MAARAAPGMLRTSEWPETPSAEVTAEQAGSMHSRVVTVSTKIGLILRSPRKLSLANQQHRNCRDGEDETGSTWGGRFPLIHP
jgi:hypothetical protein